MGSGRPSSQLGHWSKRACSSLRECGHCGSMDALLHQVGLPYHWGYRGQVTGDVVNDLLAISEEPNVRIMETKALLCNVIPGRRARGREALQELHAYLGESA